MKKLFCSLILSASIFANEKPVNFLEIGVTDMDYKRPETGNEAGTLNFTEAKMSRADLTFNLQNKDEVFNSKFIYEKDNVKFNSTYLNLEFKLSDNSEFNQIVSASTKDSLAVINPSFTSFGGRSFDIKWDDMNLGLSNFFVFCSANDPEVDMADVDGITKGCLTEMMVNVNKHADPFQFRYGLKLDDGTDMSLVTTLKDFSIKEGNKISINADRITMDFEDYLLNMGDTKLKCNKDETLFELNTDKLLKDCENSIDIVSNKIVLKNKKEKTKFFINAEKLNVGNEDLNFLAPKLQIANQKGASTIFDLDVNCQKSEEATVYDLQEVIDQCLKRGRIKFGSLVSTDEKSLWWKYDEIIENRFDPTRHINPKDKSVWKLDIELNENEIFMKVKTKKGLFKFTVELKGKISYNKEQEQLVIHADSVKIPVKYMWDISATKFLVGQIADALTDAGARSEGKKIIIDL